MHWRSLRPRTFERSWRWPRSRSRPDREWLPTRSPLRRDRDSDSDTYVRHHFALELDEDVSDADSIVNRERREQAARATSSCRSRSSRSPRRRRRSRTRSVVEQYGSVHLTHALLETRRCTTFNIARFHLAGIGRGSAQDTAEHDHESQA